MSADEHLSEVQFRSTKALMRAKSSDFGHTMETVHRHAPEHALAELDKLGEDIKANGVREPIEVSRDHYGEWIEEGHHRLLAAHRAGLPKVPTKRVRRSGT